LKAIDYLKSYPWLPRSREGSKRGAPSNSELWRWLEKGSVIINGVTPKPKEEIEFPITKLVFFPKGISRTTVFDESAV